MKFLALLGKNLKDDDIIDVLECSDMEVVYQFDRSHENAPDTYWSDAKNSGFQLCFDSDQVLEVIFLYAAPIDGFSALDRADCDISFFQSISDAEAYAASKGLDCARGRATFLEVSREWTRIEQGTHSLHYEFRADKLALVTITKTT